MKISLFTAGMIVLLISTVTAQTENDPVGQWLFQIEQQIMQDPTSGERLIQRLGTMRDPDLLERLQRRWSDIDSDVFTLAQQDALFDLEIWLANETGIYDQLTSTLRENDLGDSRPERWLEVANLLDSVGAHEQARIAWQELSDAPLSVLRCRAMAGRANSHMFEGIERLTQADSSPPSPAESFQVAESLLDTLIHENRCPQLLESTLGSLLNLASYHPSATYLLDDMEQLIPLESPIKGSPLWSRLMYIRSVMERNYPQARQWVGRLIEQSGEEPTGPLRWKIALLEWAADQSDMVELQLNALRQMPESDSFNDLTTDLYLREQFSTPEADWYPQFMLFPSLSSDSLANHLGESLSEMNSRAAGLLLYRLHQHSGHLHSTLLSNKMQKTLDMLDSTDPLVPYLEWALLQQSAWQFATKGDEGPAIETHRQELRKFLNLYPSHPTHQSALNALQEPS